MNEIAPWENPNLPAPFATIEREIEGRQRHFALWQWDERLLWRDLKNPRLWWATLDLGATLGDWERAIEVGGFGRALTNECNKAINGKHIGLSPSVTFYLSRNFVVIASNNGSGIAREKVGNVWLKFTPLDEEYTKKKRGRAPSIWHPNREFFGLSREVARAFAPVFLKQFSGGFRHLLTREKSGAVLQVMKDLVALNVYQQVLFSQWMRTHLELYQKILSGFDLPDDSFLSVTGERKQKNGVQISFGSIRDYQQWKIESSIALVTTMHELLELQLHLRDSLRPILTDAEIEEILNPPARL